MSILLIKSHLRTVLHIIISILTRMSNQAFMRENRFWGPLCSCVMDMSSMGVNDFSGLYDDYGGVVIDAHKYQFLNNTWAEEPDGWSKHLAAACQIGQQFSGSPLDVIIGEWSLAITDCTVYLGNFDEPMSSDSACR